MVLNQFNRFWEEDSCVSTLGCADEEYNDQSKCVKPRRHRENAIPQLDLESRDSPSIACSTDVAWSGPIDRLQPLETRPTRPPEVRDVPRGALLCARGFYETDWRALPGTHLHSLESP